MRSSQVNSSFVDLNTSGRKALAVLFDPDDTDEHSLIKSLNVCLAQKVDFIFVGGSLVTSSNLHEVVSMIKSYTDIPCILFPGNAIQIDSSADAILFLSLISGRNPELLIGQHVVAAPVVKRSNLEVILQVICLSILASLQVLLISVTHNLYQTTSQVYLRALH